MKKWVILLMFISMIFLTGLNRIIGGNAYYYTTTVVFTLTALISYSIVTVLSYRAGVTMKNINYIYFFSIKRGGLCIPKKFSVCTECPAFVF